MRAIACWTCSNTGPSFIIRKIWWWTNRHTSPSSLIPEQVAGGGTCCYAHVRRVIGPLGSTEEGIFHTFSWRLSSPGAWSTDFDADSWYILRVIVDPWNYGALRQTGPFPSLVTVKWLWTFGNTQVRSIVTKQSGSWGTDCDAKIDASWDVAVIMLGACGNVLGTLSNTVSWCWVAEFVVWTIAEAGSGCVVAECHTWGCGTVERSHASHVKVLCVCRDWEGWTGRLAVSGLEICPSQGFDAFWFTCSCQRVSIQVWTSRTWIIIAISDT